MSVMIDATDCFLSWAMRCSSATNSGSSVILVWWPDKDTDIFFIVKISQQPGNRSSRDTDHHIYAVCPNLYCPAYNMCQKNQMRTKTDRCVQTMSWRAFVEYRLVRNLLLLYPEWDVLSRVKHSGGQRYNHCLN